ncbi:MAG: tandem-95 repeat protein, partial [Planctomycetales bacterium]|nr:tandem-95 repeat protein [Planctomycetales bacterium]
MSKKRLPFRRHFHRWANRLQTENLESRLVLTGAPVAAADLFNAANDGTSAVFDVLANDVSDDTNSSTLTISAITQGTHGTVSIGNGVLNYLATSGFVGVDTFTYTVRNTEGLTDTAEVTVAITNSASNQLSGFVYLDTDDDGVKDGTEVGVPGTQIRLTGTTTAGSSVDLTMLTEDTGAYSFTGLASGTYQLAEIQPHALIDGKDTTSASGATTSNDTFGNIVVQGGQTVANNNFGEMSLQPDFISITWFFASSPTVQTQLRRMVARAEEMAGNSDLAQAIRDGATDVPNNGANQAPVANADAYSTSTGTVLTVNQTDGVLRNDTDADGDTLTAQLATAPNSGSLVLNPNGSFTYTPASGFTGTVTFTYTANDATRTSAAATVTITVSAATGAVPVAVADNYRVDVGDFLITDQTDGVLANDTDTDSSSLTALLVSDASNGTLTLNNNGTFVYVPDTEFHGTDTFTYEPSDGVNTSNVATVTIVVNTIPVAAADSYNVNEDATLVVTTANGVLVNDVDADDDPLTATKLSDPANGTLTFSNSGTFTYTPNANFNGTDSFTYSADDGFSDSAVVSVTITVANVNDAPMAVAKSYTTDRNTTLTVVAADGVLNGASDLDVNDTLTAVLVQDVAHGDVTVESNGAFVYLPESNFSGTDTFTFRVTDGVAQSAETTVTITVNSTIGTPPTANDDLYEIAVNGTLNVAQATGVLFNDVDPDSTSLAVTVVDDVTDGTLVLNSNGSFTYDPDAGFHGADTFTYRINDGDNLSDPATVTILVNSRPNAIADNYEVDEEQLLSVNAATGVLSNDTDADSDTLTATVLDTPSNGAFSFMNNGSFTYTPLAEFNGTDTFTYRVSDGLSTSDVVTVTITVRPVNDPPVAAANSYNLDEGSVLVVNAAGGVLTNDSDVDATAPLTAVLVQDVQHGTLVLASDGSFTYEPDSGYSGTDTFTYRASDGTDESAETAVTLSILTVNDPPVAANDAYSTAANTELQLSGAAGLLLNDSDPEGNSLTASIVTPPAHGTLALTGTGAFLYTPDTDFSGTDTFTYRVNDGNSDSNVATVTIEVLAANTFQIAENSPSGTSVGDVVAQQALGSSVVYEIVNNSIDNRLVLAADDHLSGDPTAPVVLIEYLDIQCPVCEFYHPIIRSMEQTFAGELLVVRRHFPLQSVHPNAMEAAHVAEAAGRQGKFDEMVDLLYEKHDEWADEADPTAKFLQYAGDLGLNITQYNSDVVDPVITQRIQRDLDDITALGGTGTPTFYLQGTKIANTSELQFNSTVQAAVN